jgi:hypothetical protein
MRPLLVVFLLSFAAVAAAQASNDGKHANLAFDPAVFAGQKQALEHEIVAGERYRGIAPKDRERVLEALDRMETNLQGVRSVGELDERRKLAVFNDQEMINVVLTQAAEDSRLVCTRETPVGTRLATKVCKTVGERRRDRETAREALRDGSRLPLRPSN